jgi:hypothetical protein
MPLKTKGMHSRTFSSVDDMNTWATDYLGMEQDGIEESWRIRREAQDISMASDQKLTIFFDDDGAFTQFQEKIRTEPSLGNRECDDPGPGAVGAGTWHQIIGSPGRQSLPIRLPPRVGQRLVQTAVQPPGVCASAPNRAVSSFSHGSAPPRSNAMSSRPRRNRCTQALLSPGRTQPSSRRINSCSSS